MYHILINIKGIINEILFFVHLFYKLFLELRAEFNCMINFPKVWSSFINFEKVLSFNELGTHFGKASFALNF
jgi:hypothetical protein